MNWHIQQHVFISYSSEDSEIANSICNKIERDGIKCWIAPRDVMPGANWGESIIEALNQTLAMVVVFSSHSNRSEQVLREVERAIAKGKTIIIPFRIHNITPSGAMEYYLSTRQWLDAINLPMEPHFDSLIKTIKSILQLPSPRTRDQLDEIQEDLSVEKLQATINPANLEEHMEFIVRCEERLENLRYDLHSINSTTCVLSELISNAMEHGCQYSSAKRIEIICEIKRSYAHIIVQDSGQGFDPQTTMARLRESKDISRERGRGLLLVNYLSRRLTFSDSGRRIEAIIMLRKGDNKSDLESRGETFTIDDMVILKLPSRHAGAYFSDAVEMMKDLSYRKFIIDWSSLHNIGSELMTLLMVNWKQINQELGGHIVFCNVSFLLYKIFKGFGFTKLFTIKYSLEDALEHLRSTFPA